MSDLLLSARLDGDSGKLVGELTRAEAKARGLEDTFDEITGSAGGASAAIERTGDAAAKGATKAGQLDTALEGVDNAARRAKGGVDSAGQSVTRLGKQTAVATRSSGAFQAGLQQVGFQASDFFVQVGSGTSALRAFSLQGPQAVQALALMGNGMDNTGGKFARFATFLTGPWGVALTVATSVVGILAGALFEAEDASAAAELGSYRFGEAQNILGGVIDLTTGKINTQSAALLALARAQAVAGQVQARADQAKARSGLSTAAGRRTGFLGGLQNAIDLSDVLDGRGGIARGVLDGKVDSNKAIDSLRRMQEQGRITEEQMLSLTASIANLGVSQANEKVFTDTLAALDGDADALQQFLKPGQKRTGGKPRSRDGAAAATRLGRFGESSDEKIERLLAGYDPAPRGLDKPLQDLREIDRLIAEISARKPPGFETMIASAEKARTAIEDGLVAPIDAIADQFSEMPRFAAQAEAAFAELDAIEDRLIAADPPNLDQLLLQLDSARGAVEYSLVRPFRELREESEFRQRIDLLILSGREDEARVLEEIRRIERDLGPLSAERREEVERLVLAEEEHLDRLEKAQKLQSAYLTTTQDVRGELEAIFAGEGDLSNFKRIFKDLQAKILVEKIFGPALDELDQFVKENTAIEESVDLFAKETERASKSAGDFADALTRDASRLDAPAGGQSFEQAFADIGPPLPHYPDVAPEIVVAADEVKDGIEDSDSVMGLTPERYFKEMAKQLTLPIVEGLDDMFGTQFFGQLQNVFAGVLYGSATGGTVGGILGGAKGFVDTFGDKLFGEDFAAGLSGALGKGLAGAQGGTQIAGLAKSFGLNLSTTGSQIGGAIGSFIPIPGGNLIGALAGGLLGGLFKKKKYGTANITGADSISTQARGDGRASGANDLAGSVTGGLSSIAEALGANVGGFNVSIGTYKDDIRVSKTGQTGKLSGRTSSEARNEREQGLYNFGDDAEGAVAFAIADAIADGAITGISEKVQKALRSNPDIDLAIAEALKVQEIEKLLAGAADAYLEELRAFEKVAEERLRIGREYGFDLVELERVNAEERSDIIEDILDDRVGSLRDLLEDLTFGDLAEGTLADRRAELQRQIGEAETDAEAGKDGAADRLADLQRRLIELSIEAYGTAGGEYGADRDQAVASAQRIIELEEQRIRDSQAEVTSRLDTGNQLAGETNDILAEIKAALGRDVGMLPGGYGGGQFLPSAIPTERVLLR